MKFKVGDKVKVVNPRRTSKEKHTGKVFTIREINPNGEGCYNETHYGVVETAECSFIWLESELVEDKKVFTKNDLKTGMFGVMDNGFKFVVVGDNLIYSNGEWDRVASLDDDLEMFSKKVMKVYDTVVSFNNLEYTSSRPVYDRERDTKPLYNGKVVCIDLDGSNENNYTVGKIYQFENGRITTDEGAMIPNIKKIYSFDDWNNWSSSKFIEIKE